MKTYTTYQQIKDDYPYSKDNENKAYNVFTDYVMDVISLEKRKEIRNDWHILADTIGWQDYLLQRVNEIKNK